MARLVADTAPLLAASDRREPAHLMAAGLVSHFGRDLLILDTVACEMDYLLRERIGPEAARLFLESLVNGEHTPVFLTPALFRRAVEIDDQYASLGHGLGLVDASIMAYAERHKLPVLTFDFAHFRATRSEHGLWELVVDEAGYRRAVKG